MTIEIPDYLKGIVDETAKDMITSSGSAPRISLKGRKFRFTKDRENVLTTQDPIHVIIVGVVPEQGLAHTFYLNGYVPGSTDPPDCSSFFGEVPDQWCNSPQSKLCADCPHQVWGSATSMSGSKSKACKDSKRLMVIQAEEAKSSEPTIYLLNVTIASLKALSQYGKFLINNQLPMSAVITKIEFVDSDFPQIEFEFVAVLAAEVGQPMMELANKKEWMAEKPVIKIEGPASTKQIVEPSSEPTPPPPSDGDILNNWG